MAERGIDQIFYFQVDNPLVQMADPTFLGYHEMARAEMSTKVVPKRDAAEKVGVVGLVGGRFGVIEYSDLSPRELEARDAEGQLKFRDGNIATHLIRRDFVEGLTSGGLDLPIHVAHKRIACIDPETGASREVDGVKFETFVFDALRFSPNSVVLSVDRDVEFAPIKNADGEDSPATSRAAQVAMFANWLEKAGVNIPRDGDGVPTVAIEIDPTFADDAETLATQDLSGVDPTADSIILR
jgi:UDP-N-acetylglucosamine/UDP-N-acetylgalactosamine diphosphorylase